MQRSQVFEKAFNIQFMNKENKQEFAYQTSWHSWLKYRVLVICRKYPCQNANQAGKDRVSSWKVSHASF